MTSDSEIPEVGPYLPDEDEQVFPHKRTHRRWRRAIPYLFEVVLSVLLTVFVIGSVISVVDLVANRGQILVRIYESVGAVTPVPTSPTIIELSPTPISNQPLPVPNAVRGR